MTILVGCSGWNYDDWVGRFYPMSLSRKKDEWFAYYAQFFNTVEINSTFYRPPGDRQVQSWIRKGQLKDGFEYSVKVPQLVTHQSMVEGNAGKAIYWAGSFEKTCVEPLDDAGLLGGVLLQLSPYFRNQDSSIRVLAQVLDALSTREHDYAVEFRHPSWLDKSKKEIDPSVLETLTDRDVAWVQIDGPGLQVDAKPTSNHQYVRFHGRNYDIWYGKEKEDDHRLDRYDFLYRKAHLDPWIPRLKRMDVETARVRVYFNNHARAKSVKNAFLLMDMLGIEHKSKEVSLQDQFKLGEF